MSPEEREAGEERLRAIDAQMEALRSERAELRARFVRAAVAVPLLRLRASLHDSPERRAARIRASRDRNPPHFQERDA